ncbi:5'-methylthioadenosine/adenosylhomocysteine nucleosidase [Mycobacterium sp. 236(2023)]|uniref:5'-methylthioadenosine/adenosylhomocysteine nucleosidase n=1 Tax=Mycobacterium sp. 236(2023) TaxID=3038163 RepID=UPI00241536FD|nr:5'-methylthioadenosine/adenosylhomocysteine nucleosidase [Mycobacterium sp. 236(2023)]MDG4665724.1 5'-methylthioadenosine/adenosylhomocysteine nucleosidase [Mycobacterium sp. 236(2023)]
MPLGLICAIPEELTHLQAELTNPRPVRVAHSEFVTGQLDNHEVVLAGSGMGKVNSALVATVLADRFSCSAMVFSGVAGGVDPALRIGDVVIADRVLQHDAGLIEDGRLQPYQAGHVPFINPTERFGFTVHQDLLARVRNRLDAVALPPLSADAGGGDRAPRIAYGTVLSGDQFLHCDQTREQWHREFGALAVEMEGGAVAQVAEAFDIPWLVIRALSDLAGHDSRFNFLAFAEQVAASSALILRRVLPVL